MKTNYSNFYLLIFLCLTLASCQAFKTKENTQYTVEMTWGQALNVFDNHKASMNQDQLDKVEVAILAYQNAVQHFGVDLPGEPTSAQKMLQALNDLRSVAIIFVTYEDLDQSASERGTQ